MSAVRPGDAAKASVRKWIEGFVPPLSYTAACKLEDFRINERAKTVMIEGGGGFVEQFFTPELVAEIYAQALEALPEAYRSYELTVKSEGMAIEELIPNFWRGGEALDASRSWSHSYDGQSWTEDLSRPWQAAKGLEGEHIAVWQSHGRYWDVRKRSWQWQRPQLYGTCEDLFTQSIVVPYIIPMLENAGCVVWTPRERDYQVNEMVVEPVSQQLSGFYSNDGVVASWTPRVGVSGRYAVYVKYPKGESDNAVYCIRHRGGETRVRVNQRMGFGVWTYLGTYAFGEGVSEGAGSVSVTLSDGVRAGSVRFGGGMGSAVRGGGTSGLPRWAEAARYSLSYWGLPDSVTDYYEGADDYKSDILSRPIGANHIAGGSVYVPAREGLGVPIDLAIAFHSDAGVSKTDESFGSLSICTTQSGGEDGATSAGINRYASHDLCAMLLGGLREDLAPWRWHVRKLWNKNYGETRVPQMPSVILEMLSHQNFHDLELGYDPAFKFALARSVYKTLLRWEAASHGRDYVVQPLPVRAMRVRLDGERSEAIVSWEAETDATEPSAAATSYVLYVREGEDGGFDNGRVVNDTRAVVPIEADRTYSFCVRALNDGGVSFPSETVVARLCSQDAGEVLIVNGFTRLSGPASVNTSSRQGFLLDEDPGVPYGAFTGFCGHQVNFDRSLPPGDDEKALGWSGNELAGQIVMGNTFDYALLHGSGLAQQGRHSFVSVSAEAFARMSAAEVDGYRMLDVYFGVQKEFDARVREQIGGYLSRGGRVLLSGANMLRSGGMEIAGLPAALASSVKAAECGAIRGSGAEVRLYGGMNAESYAVPSTEALSPVGSAFAMMVYGDDRVAAVAYDGVADGGGGKAVVMGFPIEAITNGMERDKLMRGVAAWLCK